MAIVPESVRPILDPPSGFDEYGAYCDGVAVAINTVVCELALRGISFEPVVSGRLGAGTTTAGCAILNVSGGIQAVVGGRIHGPTLAVITGEFRHVFHARAHPIESLVASLHAAASTKVPANVRHFVAEASWAITNGALAVALNSSWIVTEQLLNGLWDDTHATRALDATHKNRLADSRTWTASAKAELLWATGTLDKEMYLAVQAARKWRNDLAHGAKADLAGANAGMLAMRLALEKQCGQVVTPLGWSPGQVFAPGLRSESSE